MKAERHQSEAAEKLARQIGEEKIAADLLALKNAKKLTDKELKDAEKALRDAEKLKLENEAKLEK
jgi:hypothetical protein